MNTETHATGSAREAGTADQIVAKPIESFKYDQFRDSVLSIVASALSETKRPLWYAEVLVLSARYIQWLKASAWARDAVRRRDRLELWNRSARPRLIELVARG